MPPFLPSATQCAVTAFAVLSSLLGFYAAWLAIREKRLDIREKERIARKAMEEDSPIARPTLAEMAKYGATTNSAPGRFPVFLRSGDAASSILR
jgi:hypothetical protein